MSHSANMVPLGKLGKVISGSTPNTNIKAYWNGDIPWITPADLTNHEGIYFKGKLRKITKAGYNSCSAIMLPPSSIIFSSRAPIGHCAVTGYALCTNQGFKSIVPNENLDSIYGFFALKFFTPQIIARGRGATFLEVSKEIIEDFPIPLPPLPKQKRIANTLEQADHLLRLRRYALELSDNYLQSVFLEMFGDPVSNPKGWKESPLDEAVTKDKFAIVDGPFGSDLKADEYTNEGVRVIKVNNIKPNEFNFDDVCHVSLTKYQSIKRSTVRPGDVVMAKVGNTIGKTCVFPDSIQYAVLTANVCKMTLNTQIALPWFLSYQMNFDGIQQRIRGLSGDTAKPMINIPRLRELKLILPDIPKQQEYVDIVLRHKRLQVQQREAERQAEHLFQTLLRRAFRGELS